MTAGARAATQWWHIPPGNQLSYLAGLDPDLLDIALDPLPEGAPAVVQFRPPAARSMGELIDLLLERLDITARSLFPRWLPGAERFETSGTLGMPALRAFAHREAGRSQDFGPFLADLAERAATSRATARPFPAEVRAAGLARVIARAYARSSAVTAVEVPPGLAAAAEDVLVGACEWLAWRGGMTVWLVGEPLHAVDRVRVVAVSMPAPLTRLAEATPAHDSAEPERRPVFSYPSPPGAPRADSEAEQALEHALAPQPWAQGREWNRRYQATELAREYRLDLCWPAERVVVEVDGADHRRHVKWADDRARDVHLQMYGYAVLRFANEDVLADVQLVVHQIHRVLNRRRDSARIPEMRHHAD
ncbi:DUF559 domain-containing protein [Catellatospora sp. NPDC049111]|uniref:endonuclease domain-containing protein n=1 Tax=Catellatospora sp. NPDC049111 TaxID=3155271 RepID=UPI00340FE7A4